MTRLWQIDAAVLLSRPGLARFAPLGAAGSTEDRRRLVTRAVEVIGEHFDPEEATAIISWMAELATLYLPSADLSSLLQEAHMPIDLSDSDLAKESRAQGRVEGRAEGETMARRQAIYDVTWSRHQDRGLAERAAAVPDQYLRDLLPVAATTTATDLAAWLDDRQA